MKPAQQLPTGNSTARRGRRVAMTRRVVMAIVVNVWLVLNTAGCSTYFILQSPAPPGEVGVAK